MLVTPQAGTAASVQADRFLVAMRCWPQQLLLVLIAISLLGGAIAAQKQRQRVSAQVSADHKWNASVTVDLAKKKEISRVLYGIFFEEVCSGRLGQGQGACEAAGLWATVYSLLLACFLPFSERTLVG